MQPRPASPRLRACTATALALLALVAGATVGVVPAHAENQTPAAAAPAPRLLAPPSPDLPGLPATSIALARVPVTGSEFDRAAAQYRKVDTTHSEARGRRHDLDHTTTVLEGRVRELDAVRASARARAAGLTARLETIEGAIQELAVRSFMAGGDEERLNGALVSETPAISEVDRRDVFGGLTMEVLLAERRAYRARIAKAKERADGAVTDLTEARDALRELAAGRPKAVRAEVDTAAAVATERVSYEEARVLAKVKGVEFQLVALDAYYRAADSISDERPDCGVRWWGLAGISRVEGHHGTYGGTTLQPNGDTAGRIIGIQLNGTHETAVVGDSDSGALDGDPAFDHAIGPMQFIPQTWSRFQADGNGDGTISPFNMYDATLAAAKYLCTSRRGLDADPGLRAAYFSYNHSAPYVDSVLAYARRYERAIEVPEPTD